MGVRNITADYIESDVMNHLLSALMPENRLAVLTSMVTGLRISDVLSLKTAALKSERFTVKEMKTGKAKRIRLPKSLYDELLANAGRFYVFENRLDARKHRTRQAVWKDLKRASELFRVKGLSVSPHTARKIYAVNNFKRSDLKHVQELLNHSSEAVTVLYAMADLITERKAKSHTVSVPKF